MSLIQSQEEVGELMSLCARVQWNAGWNADSELFADMLTLLDKARTLKVSAELEFSAPAQIFGSATVTSSLFLHLDPPRQSQLLRQCLQTSKHAIPAFKSILTGAVASVLSDLPLEVLLSILPTASNGEAAPASTAAL